MLSPILFNTPSNLELPSTISSSIARLKTAAFGQKKMEDASVAFWLRIHSWLVHLNPIWTPGS
ncbi:hypothetical protein [Xenorhabdus mauleonii]|uniref:hypothetical protein n=1 Tax=Xenorhabdus mauleonii TaxID=351675 RepID=UPI0030DC456A